jgi:hypothetical protein
VIAVTLGGVFVGLGLFHLIRGKVKGAERLSRRTVRGIAVFQIVLGVGVGFAGFFVEAEPPGHPVGKGHWGGTGGIVLLSIWLALLLAILGSILRKYSE